MASPGLLAYNESGSNSNYIVGPIVATFAIVACWEATNVVRKFNYPCGAWLIVAPWILGYDNTSTIINDMACGISILILASLSMKIEKSYGGGWTMLWK